MSTNASNSQDSHCSGTPTIDKRKSEKPPFNLYFAKRQPVGRSNFHLSQLDGVIKFIEKYITPKFYSRYPDTEAQNAELSREIIEQNKVDHASNNCRDLNRISLLSSQSYGWWYDRHKNSKDPRFNFHRNTSDMVHINTMIQWHDKKLRDPHH